MGARVVCAVLLFFAVAAADHGGFVKARGRVLVDARGDTVLLRGVNLGNWLNMEGYLIAVWGDVDRQRRFDTFFTGLIGERKNAEFWKRYRDNIVTEADFRKIREDGFNSVRVAINAQIFISEDSASDAFIPQGFAYLDSLAAWCGRTGVWAVIDMHAAPGGQTGQNIDNSRNDHADLFFHEYYRRKLVALWTEIARRNSDKPAILGYDLLNEPLPSFSYPELQSGLEPLYKRITAAIRSVDRNHVIVVEGSDYATNWKVFSKPFDTNMMYEFHRYETHPSTRSLKDFLAFSIRNNVPVWCGEFGEDSDPWCWNTALLMESNGIGWCFWPWKKVESDNCPYSIAAPAGWQFIRDLSDKKVLTAPADTVSKILDHFVENAAIGECKANNHLLDALFRRIPARFEAENFGFLGRGLSFSVKPGAAGSRFYRTDTPVPIEPINPEYKIGFTEKGEWTAYKVRCGKDGMFDMQARVSTSNESGTFRIELDGRDISGPVTIKQTGGWNDFVVTTIRGVRISKGSHVIRYCSVTGGVDYAWLAVLDSGGQKPVERPGNARMISGAEGEIPGRFEAIWYGTDGVGKSYFDKTPGTEVGDLVRNDDVDINYIRNDGFQVTLEAAEWLSYEFSNRKARPFTVKLRARSDSGAAVELLVDGAQAAAVLIAGREFTDIRAPQPVLIKEGTHTARLRVTKGTAVIDWFELD